MSQQQRCITRYNTRPVVLNLPWFVAPFQRLSTLVAPCSSIQIPSFVLGFAIPRQSYSVAPGEPLRGPQEGPWAPVEKPCTRQSNLLFRDTRTIAHQKFTPIKTNLGATYKVHWCAYTHGFEMVVGGKSSAIPQETHFGCNYHQFQSPHLARVMQNVFRG